MDAEERALLAAIIAQPDDDTARLVYADWLQEHGQEPRAEYIRLSIQLANLRYGEPNFKAEEARILEQRRPLVERLYGAWQQEFAARFPANRDVTFIFGRGFVEQVWCSVKYFLDNGEKILRETPLRSLVPRTLTRATARRLLKSPLLKRLRRIRLLNPPTALAILDAPGIEIGTLDFSQPGLLSTGYWDTVAESVSAHGGLSAVRHITFENCGIGNLAGACLADARLINPDVLNLLGSKLEERVKLALRKRYGPRVWIDPADRNGFRRGY
jgi:uncharacterized protein (TIGR02996 family)